MRLLNLQAVLESKSQVVWEEEDLCFYEYSQAGSGQGAAGCFVRFSIAA